jgi:hypothetical protein
VKLLHRIDFRRPLALSEKTIDSTVPPTFRTREGEQVEFDGISSLFDQIFVKDQKLNNNGSLLTESSIDYARRSVTNKEGHWKAETTYI